MTTKQELLALAERVEKGEDHSRSLDADVSVVLSFGRVNKAMKHPSEYVLWVNEDSEDFRVESIPKYTTSLDAAKALHDAVLPGVGVDLFLNRMKGRLPQVHILKQSAEAQTPVAAWVAAILRAKAEEVE